MNAKLNEDLCWGGIYWDVVNKGVDILSHVATMGGIEAAARDAAEKLEMLDIENGFEPNYLKYYDRIFLYLTHFLGTQKDSA